MLTRQVIVDQDGKTIGVILPIEEYSLVRDMLERPAQAGEADMRDRAEAALTIAGLIHAPPVTRDEAPAVLPLRRKALAETYTAPVRLSDLVSDDREGS